MRARIDQVRFRAGPWATLMAALAAALALSSPLRAEEAAPAKRDTAPRLSIQTPYAFNSGGAQGSYYFQTTPGTAFNSTNATRGFSDLGVAQPLGFARDLGIGNVSATLRSEEHTSEIQPRG